MKLIGVEFQSPIHRVSNLEQTGGISLFLPCFNPLFIGSQI